MRRRTAALLGIALALTAAFAPLPASAGDSQKDLALAGGPTSTLDPTPVKVDARLYLPEQTPAPAVLLAHGFGGSKEDLGEQAQQLQAAGYVVLTYSARGFGKTAAPISMNSPQFEIADARALVDYLGNHKAVLKDSAGDPRVGVAGGSYGGALALMLAGYDNRVDAVASDITWNSLRSALYPQASDQSSLGVFKKLWTSYFFSVGMAAPPGLESPCGRFAIEWCAVYQAAATGQPLTAAAESLMYASSPASVTDRITAPTLLMAGQADSLFPLTETDATFRQIHDAQPNTELKLVWHAAGHDGGIDETDRLRGIVTTWFDKHLFDRDVETGAAFTATLANRSVLSNNSNKSTLKFLAADSYPGITGNSATVVSLVGKPQRVVAPAGGEPAIMTVLPGLGGNAAALLGRGFPNQSALFETAEFSSPITVVGASKVKLRITPLADTSELALFASLRITSGETSRFPNGLVAPIRLTDLRAGENVETTIQLPAIVAEIGAGESLQLVVSATDAAYSLPSAAGVYEIALADKQLLLPESTFTLVSDEAGLWTAPFAAGIVLLVALVVLWWRRPRPNAADFRADLADVPLQVEGLVKQFKGGQRAVDDISWTVPPGVVIGLLGPNGAGKTTTMRIAMGLIQPTAGSVYVFGQQVHPGSPVLSRIGALVEGAGFLPHLTGRENLKLFWQASGRTTEDAQLDAVLAIADLGTAVDRKVRTYSQGMRQRLGIAQAMLGMPEILLLDEPTNGLDPPQIREMRQMMKDYAATGRTVIVSSHMLSEVEQSCSHVIVMHRGRLVTAGRVDELLAGRTNMHLEDFFLEVVGNDLTIGKS